MDKSRLNKEQLEAVEHTEGPLLILAGAGSGKTMAMTHRIANIIEKGTDPYNILAVTFTNKAAAEMRQRVEKLTPDTRGLWIMTFHAMCLRILRYHAEVLGYKKGFTIYDESDKKSLIKRIIKKLNINDKNYPVSLIMNTISKCKEAEEDPEKYYELNSGDFRAETIYNIYREYMDELISNNAMDFDDLLLNGVKLLEKDESVLKFYQDRFKYVMVDEYQDTNFLQYKLVKYLSGGYDNLCVVGDDDQCIYQWRGADIRNILDFEKDFPSVKTIRLEQNYRSDGNILSLANSIIKNNSRRKKKKLWTEKSDGAKIEYKRCGDEKLEAYYIGTEIERLKKEGTDFSDIAILYRKNAQSRAFEEKFSFRGIPYRVVGGMRYYDRKEVKDVMAYMRLIDNQDDDNSMLRIINEPKRGIGPKTLGILTEEARAQGISIFEVLRAGKVYELIPKKAGTALRNLVQMIEDCSNEIDNMRISDLYDNILKRSGYLMALENADTVEADTRIENIMEFKSVIEEFENNLRMGNISSLEEEVEKERKELIESGFKLEENTELGQFLENITLMSDIDNKNSDEDAVSLMTMHSAKGLEFKVVFMPGMEDGIFPGVSAFDDREKLEEERRLCYVGITRAKKILYLTSATMRMLYGKTDYTRESMFLGEMDKKLFGENKPALLFDDEDEGERMFGSHKFKGRNYGTSDGYSNPISRKPFDVLRNATDNINERGKEEFEIGDRLRHPKFGVGVLKVQDEKTMTIEFDEFGKKKIGKGFVKIVRAD